MEAHRLYKIETPIEYYLYVLQKRDYVDSMDILAIRSDFAEGIFPLYSPGIEYKEDLGYPTPKTLININHNFYTTIKTAIICCNLNFKGNNLRENVGMFLRENISALCYDDISNTQNGRLLSFNTKTQHTLFASINRTISSREVFAYVQDKIPA
jgi:hypothetical protein